MTRGDRDQVCQRCGQVHKGALVCVSGVMAANANFNPVQGPRRRLTVAESLERTKARYAKTLKHLA